MTKTPNLSVRWIAPGRKRSAVAKGLKEPFISPGGSTHTTLALEKSKLRARWLVLLLLSLLMVGNYYCYDNPASLYALLAERFASTPHFDLYFGWLYSVYSLPNIVLPLFGGMLVDRAGVVFSLNLFAATILTGQAVFAAACSANSLPGMLVGRAIFGLGGESLSVAQSAFVTRWFQSRELALALGLSLSVSRFGSVLNNALSPVIAAAFGSVPAALWAGAAMCALSVACALSLGALDAHHTREICERFRIEKEASAGGDAAVSWRDLARLGRPFWLLAACCMVVYGCVLPFNNVASALLLDRDYFPPGSAWAPQHAPPGAPPWVYDPQSGAAHPPGGAACDSAHGRASPFCRAEAEARAFASLVMSEPYILSALLTPLLGSLVDAKGGRRRRRGARTSASLVPHLPRLRQRAAPGESRLAPLPPTAHAHPWSASSLCVRAAPATQPRPDPLAVALPRRASLCVLSALTVLCVHLALGLTALPAAALLLGLGLGYAVFASVIWPSVAYVVDSKALGTAYGVVTSLQNLGLCLIPIAVGAVHEATRGWGAAGAAGAANAANAANAAGVRLHAWTGVELLFALLGGLGILAGLGLNLDPLVRAALNHPTGRLPDGGRIFVQEGWERSPVSTRPSPLLPPRTTKRASPPLPELFHP